MGWGRNRRSRSRLEAQDCSWPGLWEAIRCWCGQYWRLYDYSLALAWYIGHVFQVRINIHRTGEKQKAHDVIFGLDRNEIVKMKTGRYHAMMHLRLVASGASNSASFALCHPPHKSNTHGDMLYWLPTTILRRLCPPQLGTVWPQLDLSLAVTSHSFEFYDQPQAPFLCEWQAVQRIPWDLRLECHLAEPSRVEMGGNDIFLVTCLGDFRGYAHCDVKSC